MVKDFDKAVDDLMAAIRKNTQGSQCIEVFGNLLKEIEDKEFTSVVIADMNRFIEHMMHLYKQLDLVDDTVFKAQILTYDFIKPEQYFKKTLHTVKSYAILNDTFNEMFDNSVEKGAQFFNIHINNRLGRVDTNGVIIDMNALSTDSDEIVDTQEDMRKIFLMWNYCPAIVKAVLQTKRRTLNLDANSKKFK